MAWHGTQWTESNDRSLTWHAGPLQWIDSIHKSKQSKWHFRFLVRVGVKACEAQCSIISRKLQDTNKCAKGVIEQDEHFGHNAETMCCWFFVPIYVFKNHIRIEKMEQYSSFRMPVNCRMLRIYIYLFRHFHQSLFAMTRIYVFALTTSRWIAADTDIQFARHWSPKRWAANGSDNRHKLKHQPIHYQGSFCDNHKVNVCIQFVCTNEFSPLQIRMTFICEIIYNNNFILLFGRPIFTISMLSRRNKKKQ